MNPQKNDILKNIAESDDKALFSCVKIFDNINIKSTELLVDKKEFEDANKQKSKELSYAINCAIQNVQKFHTAQKEDNIIVETMLAGPSEVMILADDTANPQFICVVLQMNMLLSILSFAQNGIRTFATRLRR